MIRILHFSPVRKPPSIVQLHLESLEKLLIENFEISFSFFDDNIDTESTLILENFVAKHHNSFLQNFDLSEMENYCGEERWHPILYSRITLIKNRAIEFFLKNDYDFLFFTDSDLIIQPNTLKNLLDKRKDFISTIFWTHFDKSVSYTPNAWYSKYLGFEKEDLLQLRETGTFKVDFTGACTLLSRDILQNGVSFKRIPVLHYMGEDKHFCIRASALDYEAFVNTEYPAFHLYKDQDVIMGRMLLDNNFLNPYLVEWLDKEWENKIDKWLNPKKTLLRKLKKKFS